MHLWHLLVLFLTSLGTSGRSGLGRISCSRVPRRWSACPRRRIPFFRKNRRGYCCTNARVERSLVLEGLAGQAASAGPRTGSCCCICKSAISSSRKLLYTVSVPPDRSPILSPVWCVTLLLPVLLAAARLCRGAGWGVREAGWKHEWKVTSQRLL